MENQLKILCSNIDDLKSLRDKVEIFYCKQSTTSSSTINSTNESTGDEPIQLINCNPDNQDIDSLIIQMKETIQNGRIYFHTLYNQPEQTETIKTLLQSHRQVLNDLESFVNSLESKYLINSQQSTTSDQPIHPLSPEIIINYHKDDKSTTSSTSSFSSTIIYFDQSKSSSSQSLRSTNKKATIQPNHQFNCPSSPSTSIDSSIRYDYKYNRQQLTTIDSQHNKLITFEQLNQLFNNLMSNKLIQMLTLTSFILLLILVNRLP